MNIEVLNKVEGFNPEDYIEEYPLPDGKTMKKLPVRWRIAWFRLKYGDGKIKVDVSREGDVFTATAYVYANRMDPEYAFIANGSTSRSADNSLNISPIEWAQTAAIGVALRNAGFGLDYEVNNGSAYEDTPEGISLDELMASAKKKVDMAEGLPRTHEEAEESEKTVKATKTTKTAKPAKTEKAAETEAVTKDEAAEDEVPPIPASVTSEEVKKAYAFVYHGRTHNGETLGDILSVEPRLIKWLSEKPASVRGSNEARIIVAYIRNS